MYPAYFSPASLEGLSVAMARLGSPEKGEDLGYDDVPVDALSLNQAHKDGMHQGIAIGMYLGTARVEHLNPRGMAWMGKGSVKLHGGDVTIGRVARQLGCGDELALFIPTLG